MARYRCIGWGTTNSSGVATLDYDADGNQLSTSGYTGQGVGLVDIVASAESPSEINSSSDVSQPSRVIDGVFYDDATSQNTSTWNNMGCTASYGTTGTTLSQNTDYRYQVIYNVTTGMAVEFDVNIPSSSSSDPQLYLKGITESLTSSIVSRDANHHIKIEFGESKHKLYVDGTVASEKNIGTNNIFQFRVNSASMTFKDFVIYPI